MSTCGILFDFDGTLANTTPLILATFHKTLGHFAPGKTFTDQDIISTFGLPLRRAQNALRRGRGVKAQILNAILVAAG